MVIPGGDLYQQLRLIRKDVRGEDVTILGGVGGNPWISVQFKDGNDEPIGREFLLGRCVQLSK